MKRHCILKKSTDNAWCDKIVESLLSSNQMDLCYNAVLNFYQWYWRIPAKDKTLSDESVFLYFDNFFMIIERNVCHNIVWFNWDLSILLHNASESVFSGHTVDKQIDLLHNPAELSSVLSALNVIDNTALTILLVKQIIIKQFENNRSRSVFHIKISCLNEKKHCATILKFSTLLFHTVHIQFISIHISLIVQQNVQRMDTEYTC